METFSSIILIVILIATVYILTILAIKETYVQATPHYKTLGSEYTNPLFSPCIAKRCSGGPYMFTGNPYLQQVCQSIPNYSMAQIACGKAFNGKPVHFDYTPLSDWNWSNEMCDAPRSKVLCPLGC
jgi:hypothetical protein